MITEAREYLSGLLRSVMGEATQVFLTEKELAACMDSHVAAVLILTETLVVSGKRIPTGEQRARRKFERSTAITVAIGAYDFQTLEGHYAAFLAGIKALIPDADGFGIGLEPSEVQWLEKSDQLLRANVSVVITINCTGGIYLPVVSVPIRDYAVEVQRTDN